jgi:MFS family permease
VALGTGLVVTSRATSLGIALAAYGLGVGIGVACAYVPMVALVGAWFERRRTLALGVAVAGIGIGTLMNPPATAALIEKAGWRDSYLVLAAIGVGALALCALAVAPAPEGERAVAASLRHALRDSQYRRLYAATALLGVPLFVPFVYLPSYAEQRGVDPVLAAGLIGAIGTASVAGRLALGAVAGPLGLLRVFRGCFLAMALSFALWLVAGGSYPVLLLFAIVLGVGYGGYVALAPAVVAERFGVERLGALLGVLYTSAGIGTAVGAPAAGAIIDVGGYTPAITASLAIGLASFVVVAAH